VLSHHPRSPSSIAAACLNPEPFWSLFVKIRPLAVIAVTLVALTAAPLGPAAEAESARSSWAPTSTQPRSASDVTSDKRDGDTPKPRYTVAQGPTFTNPLDASSQRINKKIVRVINHTRRGAIIRMASWNFDSYRYVGALTAAHERGVSVRLIMARTLAAAQGPGGPYGTLKRNLAGSGNDQRPAPQRSWFRTCSHSCRGIGGAMHSKFYIFSRSGASDRIVMNTSANLTAAAARVQWNDLFTVVGRKITYDSYLNVFNQMTLDRKAKYAQFTDGSIVGWFYPRPGRSDLVTDMLDKVQCKGAKGAGINGFTAIRVGMDVFNNERGARIARQLKTLSNRGCNIRIVYSQAVGPSREIIKTMPNTHLVQDRDGDGSYDRYLHAKVMTISGFYDGVRNERILLNGSANWSGTAIQSDEQGMIINRDAAERAYTAWINDMFRTHLVSAPYNPELDPDLNQRGRVDPYANMEF